MCSPESDDHRFILWDALGLHILLPSLTRSHCTPESCESRYAARSIIMRLTICISSSAPRTRYHDENRLFPREFSESRVYPGIVLGLSDRIVSLG